MVWLLLYTVLIDLLLLDLLLALVVIFTERHSPTSTIAWLLLVLFIPLLGFVFYLLFGLYVPYKRRSANVKSIALTNGPTHWDFTKNDLNGAHPELLPYLDLIRLNFRTSGATLTVDNGVEIYADGTQLFAVLYAQLKNAKQFIHLETYIIRDDGLGRQLIDILATQASLGVDVRLLCDGIGNAGLPRSFFSPLKQAGGHVTVFSPPFLPYISGRINYRNHRKIAVIDGHTAFVGGFNIGDEYLGESKMGYWRDLHLGIQGSAAQILDVRFQLDWHLAGGGGTVVADETPPSGSGRVPIQIVSSGPGSQWPAIMVGYLKIIAAARHRIVIETPYFVPTGSLAEALKVAALGGVDVKVIVPKKPDHPLVRWVSQSYFEELLQAGVRFYRYEDGFIHSKAITVDGCITCIGTANFDVRSFHDNFEVNAVLYGSQLALDLEQIIAEDLIHCREVTREDHCKRSSTERLKEAFCRLLSPLL